MFKWTAPLKEVKTPKVVEKSATKGALVNLVGEVTMIKTMADRGVRVQLDLGELTPFDIARVFSMLKTPVKVTMEHYEANNET